jgi:DNA-binding SARP family transcriptional activator/tetratricopeptide (TPR) repeat protein
LAPRVEIAVLGPLCVTVGGASISVGPPKQQLLLAVLVDGMNTALTPAALVDALWGDRPPESASSNVRQYVHRLRRILGSDAIVGRGAPTYRLGIDPDDVDIAVFERRCAAGATALAGADPAEADRQLTAALRLWRGRPFAGLDDEPALATRIRQLEETRLLAVEHRARARLAAGRATELVNELIALVDEYPHREGLVAVLMSVLHGSDRSAEALHVYHRTCVQLREELGVDPGAALQTLYASILRADHRPDPGPVLANVEPPAELPPASRHYTGRRREQHLLDRFRRDGRRDRMVSLVLVTGAAGVGKTALAACWGRRRASSFPDGQLFVDLRGFSSGPPLDPLDVLQRLLRSLRVDLSRFPDSLDEMVALYRSVTLDRTLLVVLDNAVSAAQVRPLLPSGPGNLVLVTSRRQLPGLVAHDGARSITLEPLPSGDAVQLLTSMVGRDRMGAEPAAARRLAERCSRLPLALCIAAADLANDRFGTLEDYLDQRRPHGWLESLRSTGDSEQSVKTAFDLSRRALSPAEQRTFRLLGLVPGPDFTVAAAAALAGGDDPEVAAHLRRLSDGHLVQMLPRQRFAFHDLIREYAREEALSTETAEEQQDALARLYAYYIRNADAAAQVSARGVVRRLVEPGPAGGTPVAPSFSEASGREWLVSEERNLVAACRHTAEHGPFDVAWRIADALCGYACARQDLVLWETVSHAAGRAAVAAGEPAVTAFMAYQTAVITDCRRDWRKAVEDYRTALELSRQAWPAGEATVLNMLAAVHHQLGEIDEAHDQLVAALALSRRDGQRFEEAKILLHLGINASDRGQQESALLALHECLRIFELEESRFGQAMALLNTAEVHLWMRDLDTAAEQARVAARLGAELDALRVRVNALVLLGAAHRLGGDLDAARRHVTHALDLTRDSPDRQSASKAHHNAGLICDATGEPARGIAHHRTAHRLAAGIPSHFDELHFTIQLHLAEHRLGGTAATATGGPLRTALQRARDSGYRPLEGLAHAALAEVYASAGATDDALEHAVRAVDIQRKAGWLSDPEVLHRFLAEGSSELLHDVG